MGRFYGALVFAALALGCSSSEDATFGANATSASSTSSGTSCVPGQQIACSCGGGMEGFQVCNAEGAGYGPCSCGGAGGAGGAGGGAGGAATGTGGAGGTSPCSPNATVPCYEGPAGTEDKGICVGGTKTCLPDGSAFGSCMGQVLPSPELCATPGDDDCDGQANEEGPDCACVPGSTTSCYSGPANTENVGICHGGLQLCNADGMGYGACGGEVLPQSDDCNTPIDENCDGVNASCNVGLCLFSKRFNGYALPGGMALDSGGNIFLSGYYEGAADIGGPPLPAQGRSFFIAKLDLSGNHVWSHGYSDFSAMNVYDVETDAAGNMYVAGGYKSALADIGGGLLTAQKTDAAFVAKYDAAGNHVWSKGYAGKAEFHALALDATGNLFLTGWTTGTIDYGGGPLTAPAGNLETSLLGVKLNANGQHVWSKVFATSTGTQSGDAVAVDAAGNVWLTGNANGTVDFGGGPMTSAGGALFFAKLTTSGAFLYATSYAIGSSGNNILVDPAGNVLLTGWFTGAIDFGGGPLIDAGQSDFFLAKFDANGGYQWSKGIGGPSQQYFVKADMNASGELMLAGYLKGTADFGGGALTGGVNTSAIFVAKYDALGNHVYSRAALDVAGHALAGVAIDDTGTAVLVGGLTGTIDFGCGAMTAQSPKPNADVAKLSP